MSKKEEVFFQDIEHHFVMFGQTFYMQATVNYIFR